MWAQEFTVALAETRAKDPRAAFVVETHTLPRVGSYVPLREDYDPELVLRDPAEHLAQT